MLLLGLLIIFNSLFRKLGHLVSEMLQGVGCGGQKCSKPGASLRMQQIFIFAYLMRYLH